jgi:hypothetical protein
MRHTDDLAVDRFARAMRKKLTEKRIEGYSGWDYPYRFPISRLKKRLADQVAKGNMVNIANFAMMIWNRERAKN